MSWINFFFFVIILNTVTGTVAYLLCKLLTRIAEKAGAIRVIYLMYRLVLIFYIVPLGWICSCVRSYRRSGSILLGDSFYGNPLIFWIIQIALIVWIVGMIYGILRKAKEKVNERAAYRLKMQNNIPFRADWHREMLKRMYPHKNWKRVRFCTNFMMKSPVVSGVFTQTMIFPECRYSKPEMQVILMHEGMHIVRFDNLVKMIILTITYIDWFNPLLDPYLKEMDKWADISCDISVCNKFLGGKTKLYFDVLISARDPRRISMPAFVSQLNSKDSIERRMNYMIQWKRSGGRKLVSALRMATLIAGSSVTAFAASGQVATQQNDLYREIRVTESEAIGEETDQEIHFLPADQVDQEKWDNAIVYEEAALDPLTVQKNFTWTVPPDNFVRSTGFIKQKGGQIIVSCYLYSQLNHRVGIRRPDGSQLYVLGTHQITKTFNCESTGTYYVFVENMGRVDIKVSGYYIR